MLWQAVNVVNKIGKNNLIFMADIFKFGYWEIRWIVGSASTIFQAA